MDDKQAEIIAFLSRPASYGLAVGERVETIRTHASIVFLIGGIAMKLKRSVRFAYLDYSTAEHRRRCCEAELRLNRRTAPELYRAVRAVTREADGRLALDGRGPAIDWVVEMRRFPADALLLSLAERGALSRALLEALAAHIADFHEAAEPVPAEGGAAAVAALIAMNDRSLREAGLAPRRVDLLRSRSAEALARIAPLLDRRRAAGKVRRCHGDLHLGNICLLDGRPVLFDGIEFSDEIACIDVLYDLAFLLMDLGHRGLAEAANLVFNLYLDRADEADGLAALPLFLSLRAAIRAHVRATAGAVDEEARAYLDLALRLLCPAPPMLVAIGGLSGTGKSTVAGRLAPGLAPFPGARLLRTDVLRKRQAGVALDQRLPPEFYTQAAIDAVYDEMTATAQAALAGGHSVILDAVAAQPAERRRFAALAAELGVPFRGIWLEASVPVLEGRLQQRRGDASDATVAVLHQQLRYDLGAIDWARIDAAGSVEATVGAARQAVADQKTLRGVSPAKGDV
jgi:aminoglycoside phosphotransferase family enzyme/predicted kinase